MPVVHCGQLLLGTPLGLTLVRVQVHGGVEQGQDVRIVVVAARDQGPVSVGMLPVAPMSLYLILMEH